MPTLPLLARRSICRKRLRLLARFLLLTGIFLHAPQYSEGAAPVDTTDIANLWALSTRAMGDTLIGLEMQEMLKSYFSEQNRIDAPLPTLYGLRDLPSPDNQLRIICWGHQLLARDWVYLGVIIQKKKNTPLTISMLRDRRIPIGKGKIDDSWLHLTTGSHDWLGAIYFSIMPFPYQNQTAYMLVGLAGGDDFVARRVIETLYLNDKGEATFGLPVIAFKRQRFKRLLFSHGARIGMDIRFLPHEKTLIIDHLSPAKPELAGIPEFYGPDLSFDALILQKSGLWQYELNIDVSKYVDRPRKIDRRKRRPGKNAPNYESYTPNWKK